MTRLYEDSIDDNPYPDRTALRNFTWTPEAISDWEEIWHELWHLGYKWEWQNSDRYARRYGDTFSLFARVTTTRCAWTWRSRYRVL